MQDEDGADKLLLSEKSHLISLKQSLEVQLRKVQIQLQELNVCKSRLAAVLQERARVTDLLCNSMSSDNYWHNHPRSQLQTPRDVSRSGSSHSLQRPPTSARETPVQFLAREDGLESRPVTVSSNGSRLKAYSAPVPLELGLDKHVGFRSGSAVNLEREGTPGTGNVNHECFLYSPLKTCDLLLQIKFRTRPAGSLYCTYHAKGLQVIGGRVECTVCP